MPERHIERHRHGGGVEIDDIQSGTALSVIVRWPIHELTPVAYRIARSPCGAVNGTVGQLISDVFESQRAQCERLR
jgi:hypothetical protein